jgi:hypothetical protein
MAALDLHIHSKYSIDSVSGPERILKAARRKGLRGIAVTDHGTIRGGTETARLNKDPNFTVVVGTEIATDAGDVIGLFVSEEIRTRACLEVVDEIHGQGGVAVLPHPFKGHRLTDELVRRVDAVEVFNARTGPELNAKAVELAQRFSKPGLAGSDAHFCAEIGNATVDVTPGDVRKGLLEGARLARLRYAGPHMVPLSWAVRSFKIGRPWEAPLHMARAVAGLIAPREKR